MKRKLELNQAGRVPEDGFMLSLTFFDGAFSQTANLVRLTAAQAQAIAGPGNRIDFAPWANPPSLPDVTGDQPIEIISITERKAWELPWELRVMGETVTRLSDSQVRILSEHSAPAFEPGEPDWPRREIEELDFVIAEKSQDLGELVQRREQMTAQRQEPVARERDTEPAGP